jgi:SNF2 family DNA or RNA helicase
MTGTPIANRPYDLWSQIFFLDQGQSLGKDFADFKAKLDLSNDLDIDLSKRERFEQELSEVYARIQPFTVRETKLTAGINLPDKIFQNWACELEHRQAEIYENYKSELRARVIKEGLPVLDDASEILKRLLRLVQVASNPSMVDESYKREPGKFARLMQILHGAIDQREKAIVWTSFVDNSNWLARELDVLGVVLVNGTVDIDTRNNRLKRFKEEADTRVLVATPGAAKEGLTLTVANHAIFYDRVFSLDDYLQAQDRIHRISQTRPCYVHNLISIDTVDEWVDILIAAKGTAAQLGQGDITLEQYRSSMSYTFGEAVRRVLGFEADDMESETAQ